MPVKRTAGWAADKAAEFQRRAFRLNYMSQAADIKQCIKDNPDVIPNLRNALVDMGKLPPLGMRVTKHNTNAKMILDGAVDDNEASSGAASSGPAAAEAADTGSAGDAAGASMPLTKATRSLVPDPLPPKFKHFINFERPEESLSVPILQHLLSRVENCLSLNALKAFQPGPRRAIPIRSLQCVFEFMFHIHEKREVPIAWRNMSTMVAELIKIKIKNKKRSALAICRFLLHGPTTAFTKSRR